MAITRANLTCSGIVSTILAMFIFAGCIPTVNATPSGSDLRCDKDNTTGRGPEMNMPQNQTLSIRGKLDLSSSDLELKPSMILPSSQFTPIPANRTFTINLVDKNQDELAIYPFNLIISNARSSNSTTDDRALISAAVPYHECTARIIFKMNDKELAYQSVSPHKPDIKFVGIDTDFNKDMNESMLFPRMTNISVNWDAQDLDGDNITYSLLYSYDGGLTWDTVIDYTPKKSFTVPGDSLQGNTVNLSKFRLIATDGVNTDIKDSDPFSIPALTLGH